MSKFKNCPLCDEPIVMCDEPIVITRTPANPVGINSTDMVYWVRCPKCGCLSPIARSEQELKEIWNKRPAEEELLDALKKLHKIFLKLPITTNPSVETCRAHFTAERIIKKYEKEP